MKNSKKGKKETLGARLIRAMEQAVAYERGETKARVTVFTIPGPVNVKGIRESLGLSQSQFAARYGFSPRTLQQWEQGRSKPDAASRAYLTVIKRNHRAVEKALNREPLPMAHAAN